MKSIEILRKQMGLLVEDSENGTLPGELSRNSRALAELNAELLKYGWSILVIFGFSYYLIKNFTIFIVKLCRR